jgi:DNA mismatch endonuclease, patch repair protein
MVDVLTKRQRSYNMSMIKAGNTGPEIALRRLLSASGLKEYRLHYRLTGKPDIVFPKRKIAIFIDGCFWHKCPRCFTVPETNKQFWEGKINSNIKRDKIVNNELRKNGWVIIRIWEHEVNNKKLIKRKIIDKIKNARK